MGRASNELLEKLHNSVAEHLLEKVESGEATASEIAQAVKFLKDNGIDVSDPGESPIGGLAGSLSKRVPFTDPSDPTAH